MNKQQDAVQTEQSPRLRFNDLPSGRIYNGPDEPIGAGVADAGEAAVEPLPTENDGADAPVDAGPETRPADDGAVVPDADGEKSDPATDTPDEKPPYPRHKTLEAAEKSYAHAQAKLSQVSAENARIRKEHDELLAKLAETRAKEAAAAREDFTTKRYEQAMTALQALDEYEPEYKAQAAKVWAECHRDIAAWKPDGGESPPDPITSPTGVASTPTDDPAAGIVPAAGPMSEAAPDPEAVRGRIAAIMAENGVKESEFGIDDPVFFGFASKAPSVGEDGSPLPFEAQVSWAVEQARGHYQRIKSRIKQQIDQPMGRSGIATRVAAGAGESPRGRTSLNDIMESALSRRVL